MAKKKFPFTFGDSAETPAGESIADEGGGSMPFITNKEKKKKKAAAAAAAAAESEKQAAAKAVQVGVQTNQSLRRKLGLDASIGSGTQALEPGVKPGVRQQVTAKGGLMSKMFGRLKKRLGGQEPGAATDQIGTGTIDPSKLPQMGAIQTPGIADPAEEERKRKAAMAAAGGPKTILG